MISKELDELIHMIRIDQKDRIRFEEPVTFHILNRSLADCNGNFLHFQMLVDVLIFMKPNEKDKRDLIELCKKEYQDNKSYLNLLEEFNTSYQSSKCLWWYTRDSFVCHMLNKALGKNNVDILFLFRTIIQDIFEQLRLHQCDQPIRVYRGQIMSKKDYKKLIKSTGSFVSLSTFLSTTLDRRIALSHLNYNSDRIASDGLVSVLFEIDADSHLLEGMVDNNRPFAKIAEFSDDKDESEVLFMLGSIFRLNEILLNETVSNGVTISIIRMTWCGDYDTNLNQLFDHTRNRYDIDENNILSLGYLVYRLGKFDLAEKYYHRSLLELPSSDMSISAIYHNLGMVANAKREYDTSLEWYQKSLEFLQQHCSWNYIRKGITHNAIGNVYRNKPDYNRALESYKKAASLFKLVHDENHPYVASFYNNIGIVYYEQKKYIEALAFYDKSLAIKKKYHSPDHLILSGLYDNIGIVHRHLGQYDLALEHYKRALKIRLKSFSPQHPDIATSYMNMAKIYEVKEDLEQALSLFQKALAIHESLLPPKHPEVIYLKNAIQRIKNIQFNKEHSLLL